MTIQPKQCDPEQRQVIVTIINFVISTYEIGAKAAAQTVKLL